MTYCSILPPLPVPDLPLDPPDEPAPIGCCAYCGGDIYPGDVVWSYGGKKIHAECADGYLIDEVGAATALTALGFAREEPET